MTNCEKCPLCCQLPKRVKTKKQKIEQPTMIRDGVTWYGKMVNYTTGKAMAYATFPDNGKTMPKYKMPKPPHRHGANLKGEVMRFNNQ